MITIATTGGPELAEQFDAWTAYILERTRGLVGHYATLVRADVRARIRSQFHVTDYDASVGIQLGGDGRWIRADIGTDDPAGFRHEVGFVGVDSRNRSYHDPPRPHFAPALEQYASAFQDAVEALVKVP